MPRYQDVTTPHVLKLVCQLLPMTSALESVRDLKATEPVAAAVPENVKMLSISAEHWKNAENTTWSLIVAFTRSAL